MMTHKNSKDRKITQLKSLNETEMQSQLWINFRDNPAHSAYPTHGNAWAEFIYTFSGVMEVRINQIDYITPPRYGVWLPPNLQHSGFNRTDVSHATLYIHEDLCRNLPKHAGILLSSPLVSALFEHLRFSQLNMSSTEYQRMLQVILDQLHQAELVSSYLPSTDHPALTKLLDFLNVHPSNNHALDVLAKRINMTERTLARHCQKELGMSLHEWRQRLKITKAMSMLATDKTIEIIAFDLGYANASAFISMFKRWMNTTPDQFRKSQFH